MSEAKRQLELPRWPTQKRSSCARPRAEFSCLVITEPQAPQREEVAQLTALESRQPASKPQKKARAGVRRYIGSEVQQNNQADSQNEYERQREERIRRNQAMIKALNLQQLSADLQMTESLQFRDAPGIKGRTGISKQARAAAGPSKAARAPVALQPMRKSARQRGLDLDASQPGEAPAQRQPFQDIDENAATLTQEEYLKRSQMPVEGIRSDGRFHGWVNPDICSQYGLAANADDAWEANGGGKFTFKIDKSAIPAALKSRGWSDVRAFSSTQLRKNPNAYFYRHVAPHRQQAQGEWSEEEHALFLETARAHGSGDKWGLFASYIPERVGYQCSAYYREVIIPSGLVLDCRFRMTATGKAVFVG